MFVLKNVRILSCETKDWEMGSKSGKFYPTMIRFADKVFTLNSKVTLDSFIDQDVDLVIELQTKTPKQGQPYVALRILDIE